MNTQARTPAARVSPPPKQESSTKSGTFERVDEAALMAALADPFTTWSECVSYAATKKTKNEED